MGAQQILRTAAVAVGLSIAIAAHAAPARSWRSNERVAVIDLTGRDLLVREKLAAALSAVGLEPLSGDGIEDALAGADVDRDATVLASAMTTAEHSFGQLDCAKTVASAQTALPILAARQAGGIAVPELPRAVAYLLLCADRMGDTDAAMRAASKLRAVGGSPDVSPAILAKYPDVDASMIDHVDVEVTTEVPGIPLWIDFQPAATAPAKLTLTATEHVIAAASGSQRGSLIGTPIASQPRLVVPMPDQVGEWSAVAARIASWHGKVPSAAELTWVLAKVHARAALVRHDDVVEVWGHAGLAEPVRRLGDEDGVRSISEVDRAAALIADRVATWNEHAPDPDQPLLVEDVRARARANKGETPTKWWVYATIGAAALAAVVAVIAHYEDNDVQRVELHYP